MLGYWCGRGESDALPDPSQLVDPDWDPDIRANQIKRIMAESSERFSHTTTAKHYFHIYEEMMHRPLLNQKKSRKGNKQS